MHPLTAAQDGIWRGQQLAPGDPLYNAAESVVIDGPVDTAAFTRAVDDALTEAEALRTGFEAAADGPRQYPGALRRPPVEVEDLSRATDPDAARDARIRADLGTPADLAHGPLVRHRLFVEGDRSVWYHQAHHIALDGYGFALFARRVAERYGALVNGSPERLAFDRMAPVIAADTAYARSGRRAGDRDFWLQRLGDRPQPATPGGTPPPLVAGRERVRGNLDPERRAALDTLAQDLGVSWPDLLLAVTAAWLAEATEHGEIVLGLPVMDRMGTPALRVPCMAMNIVPLRVDVAPGDTLVALASKVAQAMLAQRPHRRYRYEWLRRDLGLVGGGRRLFGPVVNIMPFDTRLDFGGLPARAETVSAGPVEDLALGVRTRGDALELEIEGHPGLYDRAALRTHHRDWRALLERALDDPQRALVAAGPAHGAASVVEGPVLAGPSGPLPARLRAMADEAPDHIAIADGDTAIDYATLLARADACAHGLRAHGVGRGNRIAIALPRSIDAVVALLGAGLAGAAWLALDPDAPAARNRAILDDADPALLIGDAPGCDRTGLDVAALCRDDAADPLPEIGPDEVAYLVYTSGSTGTPKGLIVDHGALGHFVTAALADYGFRADDRILQFASLSFDACIEEIYCGLAAGATLLPRPAGPPAAPADLLADCAARAITVLDLPTAYWHELVVALEAGDARLPPTLRQVIVGGEAVLPERLAAWQRLAGDRVELINTYGPSETTVVATSIRLGPDAPAAGDGVAPIGRPLAGIAAAVVDARGRAAERGAVGELALSGPTLARGYLGRPERTAEQFAPLPALGQRTAYRTGDRVHLDADGCLHFHGRADDERKISGHRVTPGEIEAALTGCPAVSAAAVIPRGNALVAHVVPAGDFDAGAVRAWLLGRLPAPLVPGRILSADALPRTAGGKIDRATLRARGVSTTAPTGATPMEQRVLEVWADVLDQCDLGPQDDFFARGGTSLQTIQVAHRLGAALGRDVPLGTLFGHPVAADLARRLEQAAGDPAGGFDTLLPLREGDPGHTLYCFAPAAGLAWCYAGLAQRLPEGMRVVGVQAPALAGEAMPDDLDALAAVLADTLRAAHPGGPWRLLGWSFGGMVAHAVAARLQRDGETVERLALVDAYPADRWRDRGEPGDAEVLAALRQPDGAPATPADCDERATLIEQLRRDGGAFAGLDDAALERLCEVTRAQLRLAHHATHRTFAGDVLFAGARASRELWGLRAAHWRPYIDGRIEAIELDADHAGVLRGEPVATLARRLAQTAETPARGERDARIAGKSG